MALVLDGTLGITTNSGTAISASTIGVGGATPSASGAGISFPATQSASSDANTLDDYEEGTYTATLTCGTSGTITLNSLNTLYYTKIGRQVTVNGYIQVGSVSSPNGYVILNLPFTSFNNTSNDSTGLVSPNTLASGSVTNFWVFCPTNTATARFYLGGSTSVSSTSAQTCQANTEFRVSITYITST